MLESMQSAPVEPAGGDSPAGAAEAAAGSGARAVGRVDRLRAELRELADRGGGPPSTSELRAFLQARRVTADELDQLLAQPAAAPPARPASLVTKADVDGRLDPRPREAPGTGECRSTTMNAEPWDDPDDPFAVPDPKPARRDRDGDPGGDAYGRDDAVDLLVQDLLEDHARTGRLSRSAVSALALRRGLTAPQLQQALADLAEADIGLSSDREGDGYDGHDDLDGGAIRRQVGNAVRDQLGAYLAQAGKIVLLTAEEEVRLGSAIAAGQQADALLAVGGAERGNLSRLRALSRDGRAAHQRLVRANLRLVVSVARHPRYAYCGLDLADRIQDGNLGLLRAADKFDATRGFKFSTYATWWIRQSVERGIADRGRLIRLPVHVHEKLLVLRRVRSALECQLGRTPTLHELAAQLHEDPGTVAAMLEHLQPTLSLDAPVGPDGDVTFGDLLAEDADVDGRQDPVELVLAADRQRAIDLALHRSLTAQQRDVLVRRFGLGERPEETLQEIADTASLTRERIRQIEAKALERLQTRPENRGLYEYLSEQAGQELVTPLDARLAAEAREAAERARKRRYRQPAKLS